MTEGFPSLKREGRIVDNMVLPPSSAEQNTVSEIARRLAEAMGDALVRIILFGSCARGTAGEDSDVDLLVVVKDGSPIDDDLDLKLCKVQVDTELELGIHIDAFIFTDQEYRESLKGGGGMWKDMRLEGVEIKVSGGDADELALERMRRQQMLESAARAYNRMRSNPQASRAFDEEITNWDGILDEGLEDM
jgi:predicted nucleotidyltransferase